VTLRNPAVEVFAPVTIGHQGGRVVLVFGVDDPRHYLAWTPEQARDVANHLYRCAALAESS
jgi:hypothetical protein